MQEIAPKNFSEIANATSRKFLACVVLSASLAIMLSFMLSLDVSSTIIGSAVTILSVKMYEVIARMVVWRKFSVSELALTVVAKLCVLGLAVFDLIDGDTEQALSFVLGLFSFLPATALFALWARSKPDEEGF